jgi:hypothetical protein
MWNRLLKLLRPAVDVELRPLPPMNGGVGGESSENPLVESAVDARFLTKSGVGTPRAGEDPDDLFDAAELDLPSDERGAADLTALAGAEAPSPTACRAWAMSTLDSVLLSESCAVDGLGLGATVGGAV